MIYLHMKINKSHYTVKSDSYNQVRRLEDANAMGKMFIMIGNTNYNVAMIESFWYEEIDDNNEEEYKQRKRAVSIEPVKPQPIFREGCF